MQNSGIYYNSAENLTIPRGKGGYHVAISANRRMNARSRPEVGICGKQPEVAALQDLLIYSLKGLS